jgi:hypothetical protein
MAYRILALDGGGPWALIQAKALAALYPGQTGHQILRRFDLVIANSGGSITLAGLLKDLAPDDIAKLFLTRATDIFVPAHFDLVAAWSTTAKLAGLTAIFNDGLAEDFANMRLDAVAARVSPTLQVIIVGYDIDAKRETMFRARNSILVAENPVFMPSLVGAVHASSNAPITFFDAPALVPDLANPGRTRRYWDGAIGGYNNPVLAGVVEALANGMHDVVALSLGTGTSWRPPGPVPDGANPQLYASPASTGLFTEITALAGAVLDDPPDSAKLQAHIVLGGTDAAPRVIRASPMVQPDQAGAGWAVPAYYATRNAADPVAAFTRMINLPMDATAPADLNEIAAFADAWLADILPNQGIHTNHDTGQVLIGHSQFSEAAAAWHALGLMA